MVTPVRRATRERPAPRPPGAEREEQRARSVAHRDTPLARSLASVDEGDVAFTIDPARAEPVSSLPFYDDVIVGCLDRITMLARHRRERPSAERPRAEARILAQMDAIVAAGASPEAVRLWWNAEDASRDPWTTWAATFALTAMEAPGPAQAVVDLLEAIPGDAWEQALCAAEALLVWPGDHLRPWAAELIHAKRPAACAVAVELASRRGELDPGSLGVVLERGEDAPTIAALRALSRGRPTKAGFERFIPHLRAASPEIAWEAARGVTSWGGMDALVDVREGGPLADTLGPRALEVLIGAGDPADVETPRRVVSRVSATPDVLDAVARLGNPGSWAFLLHHADDPELADAAWDALATLFGPLAERRAGASAWRDALADRRFVPATRYRRGMPWSVELVLEECRSGELSARSIDLRLDELRARTGRAAGFDTALWTPDFVRQMKALSVR